MKIFVFILISSIIPALAFSKFYRDTCGIYFTKTQFDKNELQLYSCESITAKGPILWSDFAYEVNTPIKIKTADKKFQTVKLGSIYGFKKDNINFRYIKSMNEYLAVLYRSSAICIFIKEDVYFLYHPKKRVSFLYAINNDSSLKKLNEQDISLDFSKNTGLEKELLSLSEKLDREKTYFPYKDFFKWQMIIEKDFSNLY